MEWEADRRELKEAGAELLPDGRVGLRIHGWKIESSKASILKSLQRQEFPRSHNDGFLSTKTSLVWIHFTLQSGNDDLMSFEISIWPDEGYCLFQVYYIYPHELPKAKCKTKVCCGQSLVTRSRYENEMKPQLDYETRVKVYHPNIDLEGYVCLNILRRHRKPVLNINTVIYGQYHLLTEPNSKDPLNHDAAAELRDNPKPFH